MEIAFLFWFGWSIVGAFLGLTTGSERRPTYLMVNQIVSLVAPLLVLSAYKPPRWFRARIEARSEAKLE